MNGFGLRSYLIRPDQSPRCWCNGGRNDDTHEQIQVAHSNTNVVKHGREAAHEQSESGHADVVDLHQLLASCFRVDVSLVDVIGRDRRDRDELR